MAIYWFSLCCHESLNSNAAIAWCRLVRAMALYMAIEPIFVATTSDLLLIFCLTPEKNKILLIYCPFKLFHSCLRCCRYDIVKCIVILPFVHALNHFAAKCYGWHENDIFHPLKTRDIDWANVSLHRSNVRCCDRNVIDAVVQKCFRL